MPSNRILVAGAAALALGACANPHVVEVTRISDADLTCDQIEREIAVAEQYRRDAQDEKGVTGTNVAAVLFFWPGLIATHQNVGEATRAADDRKRYLMDLYAAQGC